VSVLLLGLNLMGMLPSTKENFAMPWRNSTEDSNKSDLGSICGLRISG